MVDVRKLLKCARGIRRKALLMGEVQGQGYVGQALNSTDVLAGACGHLLNMRGNPGWEGRDLILLSHRHYAIAFSAALIKVGILLESELPSNGRDDSCLPMSGMATYTLGMETSGNSLEQGRGCDHRSGSVPRIALSSWQRTTHGGWAR